MRAATPRSGAWPPYVRAPWSVQESTLDEDDERGRHPKVPTP
jgi:hypothetical protein